MKETIKAKNGYRIKKLAPEFYRGEVEIICGMTLHKVFYNSRLLLDGNRLVMPAYMISLSDRDREIRDNEAFYFQERFETLSGNWFEYWRDEEIDCDYLVRVGCE